MNKILIKILIDISIIGMAFAGMNIDSRFLDLYQFVMWSFVLLCFFSLLLPSKDLFKKAINNKYQTFFNWCLTIIKVIISVWVGMGILAAFHLVLSILCYARKKTHFDGLVDNSIDKNE